MGPPGDVTWDDTSAPMAGPQGRIWFEMRWKGVEDLVVSMLFPHFFQVVGRKNGIPHGRPQGWWHLFQK